MLYAGLVITLSQEVALAQRGLHYLASQAHLDLGKQEKQWISAVLEAPDDAACRQFHAEASAQAGIEYIDVVSIYFHE